MADSLDDQRRKREAMKDAYKADFKQRKAFLERLGKHQRRQRWQNALQDLEAALDSLNQVDDLTAELKAKAALSEAKLEMGLQQPEEAADDERVPTTQTALGFLAAEDIPNDLADEPPIASESPATPSPSPKTLGGLTEEGLSEPEAPAQPPDKPESPDPSGGKTLDI